ncbi:hypothetical protein [Moorena sp. SIO4G3]|uniref:hypothetical protein n=1 Tax=Moorena sp. SIO4G3 TaxID=2607821 RepID=UPI001428E3D4|nr:hypothetical protein [Moorena sp. SIO4G3]NEO76732.1 hypothetical protein [Moorena sp. SIO4G3]
MGRIIPSTIVDFDIYFGYTAFFITIRYTGFFNSCLLPLASCLLPAPCSLLPVPYSLFPTSAAKSKV